MLWPTVLNRTERNTATPSVPPICRKNVAEDVATLINAGGFLAFGLSDLPPIRQFGILAALAFVLSMLADFTALPAALWILFRARPDADRQAP